MSDSNPQKELKHEDLAQFTGDLNRFRTLNPNVIYTPGVKYVADKGGAYWLIDAIASYFGTNKMYLAAKADERLKSLQFWKLTVTDSRAVLECFPDSDEPAAINQKIEFTDFPLDEIDIWAGFDGELWTLYLASEH